MQTHIAGIEIVCFNSLIYSIKEKERERANDLAKIVILFVTEHLEFILVFHCSLEPEAKRFGLGS